MDLIQRILTAFRMCLRTYCCLPLPPGEEEADLRDVVPAFLPAVGLIIGLLWYLLAVVAGWLLPGLMGAALLTVYPFAVTGLVHLKGCWRASEDLLKGRGRMQDVPAGFIPAALLVLLALMQFAACASAERIFPLMLIPVLSRSCCALHMLKHANAALDEDHALPASLLNIEKYITIAAVALMLVFSGITGLLAGLAVPAGYALCSRVLAKHIADFDDTCGFALTVSELCGLIVLAVM